MSLEPALFFVPFLKEYINKSNTDGPMGYNWQLYKMKKSILLVSLMFYICPSFSQTQTAVLMHNDSLQMFYGENALMNAHDSAVNGDIITLSSGSFNGGTIRKAITIRGAGMMVDSRRKTYPTIIASDLGLWVAQDSINNLKIEGIRFNTRVWVRELYSAVFSKCMIGEFHRCLVRTSTYNGSPYIAYTMQNVSFVNCIFKKYNMGGYSGNNPSEQNTSFYNCYLGEACCASNLGQQNLCNCILTTNAVYNFSSYGNFYNSIMIGNPSKIQNGIASAYNCVGINTTGSDNFFPTAWQSTNNTVFSVDSIFNTFDGTWVMGSDETFELTENAASQFIGIDSTQVGIYGGTVPFNPATTGLYIKRSNVASRSTVDGKLSVDIEIVAE